MVRTHPAAYRRLPRGLNTGLESTWLSLPVPSCWQAGVLGKEDLGTAVVQASLFLQPTQGRLFPRKVSDTLILPTSWKAP